MIFSLAPFLSLSLSLSISISFERMIFKDIYLSSGRYIQKFLIFITYAT
jgi:hypothetical protein